MHNSISPPSYASLTQGNYFNKLEPVTIFPWYTSERSMGATVSRKYWHWIIPESRKFISAYSVRPLIRIQSTLPPRRKKWHRCQEAFSKAQYWSSLLICLPASTCDTEFYAARQCNVGYSVSNYWLVTHFFSPETQLYKNDQVFSGPRRFRGHHTVASSKVAVVVGLRSSSLC